MVSSESCVKPTCQMHQCERTGALLWTMFGCNLAISNERDSGVGITPSGGTSNCAPLSARKQRLGHVESLARFSAKISVVILRLYTRRFTVLFTLWHFSAVLF